MTRLEQLRALLAKATPGEWTLAEGPDHDMAIVAAAMNALPALLEIATSAKAYREAESALCVVDHMCEVAIDSAHIDVETAGLALDAALAKLEGHSSDDNE